MRVLLFALPLALAACLDRGEYPSLKPRAFELAHATTAPLPPAPPAPPARPEIVARTAALARQAREGQSAFAIELARTRPVVARAGAADSESWITAQEAVSGLEASRSPSVVAMAELDVLNLSGVDAAGLKFGENDFAAVRAAADQVDAIVTAQARDIAALTGSLAKP